MLPSKYEYSASEVVMLKSIGNRRMLCSLLMLSIFFCIGLSIAFAAQAATTAKKTPSPSGTEVKAGLGVDKLELTGAADGFEISPDTKIYAWARVRDIAADSKITIAFKNGDKVAYSKEFTVPSTPYRIYAFRTFRKGDGGDWSIVVSGTDGKDLGSTAFKVSLKP